MILSGANFRQIREYLTLDIAIHCINRTPSLMVAIAYPVLLYLICFPRHILRNGRMDIVISRIRMYYSSLIFYAYRESRLRGVIIKPKIEDAQRTESTLEERGAALEERTVRKRRTGRNEKGC